MGKVEGIEAPLRDEHVLDVDPPFAPRVARSWRLRMNAFAGRAVSDDALSAEQENRAGAARLRGRAVAPGVVEGLGLTLDAEALGALPTEAGLTLEKGEGLARSGEDLRVGGPRRLTLGALRVHAPAAVLDAVADGAPAPDLPGGDGAGDPAFPGLRPPLPRRTGPRFEDVFVAPAASVLPRAAVLVLEPVSVALLAGPQDDCPPDPRDDPFEDLQLIDGARPVLWFWPAEMVAGDGGPGYALPARGPAFRNALAWRVFQMEARLGPFGAHPWEATGLPVALLGFDADWRLDFVDRASVARAGGGPRPRSPMVGGAGTPALHLARIAQFSEQLAGMPPLTREAVAAAFRHAPPAGLLPREAVDPATRRGSVLPPAWQLSLRPIPREQADLALGEAAALSPLRLDRPEAVELLAPVPAAVYEPDLFLTEAVDPAFAVAFERISRDRAAWLARREHVRRRRDLLTEEIGGRRSAWPAIDSPPSEISDAPTAPPLSGARVRRVNAGASPAYHGVRGAQRPLTVERGGRLAAWARVMQGPANGALALFSGDPRADGPAPAGAVWGAPTALPGFPDGAARRAGDLPPTGAWTRLEVASDAWTPPEAGADASRDIASLVLGQSPNLRVEWGPVSVIDSAGRETVWLADAPPRGAEVFPVDDRATPVWPGLPTDARAEAAALEAGHGIVGGDGDVQLVAAVAALRARWGQPFLSDEFQVLDRGGLDAFIDTLRARIARTDDRVDLGFVRARADIYRIRQFMLGGDAASRLVTSPALADITARDEGARATAKNLESFFQTAYRSAAERDPRNPLERLPRPASDAAEAGDPQAAAAVVAAAPAPTEATATGGEFAFFLSDPQSPRAPLAAEGEDRFAGLAFDFDAALGAGRAEPLAQAQTFSLAGAQFMFAQPPSSDDVVGQRPVTGAVERTASVAERLAQPPAVEAHEYAIAGKREALGFAGALGSGDAREGVALGDLAAPGWQVDGDPGRAVSIAEAAADPQAVIDVDAVAVGANRHEAEYFAAATSSIDNSIALLRLMEGRVATYRALLNDAETVRKEVRGLVGVADARLREIDVEVAEARHDAGVAAALLAEETERVEAINARRAGVIARHVDGYVFRRPRAVEATRAVPVAATTPALSIRSLLACAPDDGAAPEAIRDYVDLLRETPAGWWRAAREGVTRIDRLPAARDALGALKSRAAAPAPRRARPAARSPYAKAVDGALLAAETRAETRRASAVALDAAAVGRADLTAAHEAMLVHGALADLIAGAHRRAALARRIAEEVERVGDAAACLHARFSEVAPALRLIWAERLSAFDAGAPLHDLGVLDDWGAIPLDLRRELQALTDWLFARIDRRIDAAAGAMSELVRIALLTAAEAPADRLVPATLIAPTPARPGAVLVLQANVTEAHVGMIARVASASGAMAAEAVVEDVAEDGVRARVMTVAADAGATFAAGMRFELFSGAVRA